MSSSGISLMTKKSCCQGLILETIRKSYAALPKEPTFDSTVASMERDGHHCSLWPQGGLSGPLSTYKGLTAAMAIVAKFSVAMGLVTEVNIPQDIQEPRYAFENGLNNCSFEDQRLLLTHIDLKGDNIIVRPNEKGDQKVDLAFRKWRGCVIESDFESYWANEYGSGSVSEKRKRPLCYEIFLFIIPLNLSILQQSI